MCANSEGSGEIARIRRLAETSLVAYVISAMVSWAGSISIIAWFLSGNDAQRGRTFKYITGIIGHVFLQKNGQWDLLLHNRTRPNHN